MESERQISAHSAAAAMARQRVESGEWTRDQAQNFTDTIYFLVNSGHLPDDPDLLGLSGAGWVISSGGRPTVADGFMLTPSKP